MATTPASGAVAAPIHTDALAALATPCLIVDVAALTRNLRRAANHVAGTRVKLRPHFKAHKCTALLRRQLEAGGCSGVTCATAAEALVLAEADFDDILVANQIVDRHALATLAAAAGRAHVTVAVDSHVHVGLLQRLAAKEGVDLDVLIEVDVGLHRGGLPPRSADLLSLAVAVAHAPGLSFAGLQGYEGHAVFVADRASAGGSSTPPPTSSSTSATASPRRASPADSSRAAAPARSSSRSRPAYTTRSKPAPTRWCTCATSLFTSCSRRPSTALPP